MKILNSNEIQHVNGGSWNFSGGVLEVVMGSYGQITGGGIGVTIRY